MQPQDYIAPLDSVITQFKSLRSRAKHDGLSDLPEGDVFCFLTRARAAIHRIAERSVYVQQCEEIIQDKTFYGYKAMQLVGVLESIRADIDAGYLSTIAELIHGELFGDFLEMSQHLLDEGYKDAAAVIAGSSLEAHLRQLCHKNGIDTETTSPAGTSPKKADRLNSDLAKADIYSKLDQKNVTAWLDLRNKAAHGNYDQYELGQVALLISSVRDFITRNPA